MPTADQLGLRREDRATFQVKSTEQYKGVSSQRVTKFVGGYEVTRGNRNGQPRTLVFSAWGPRGERLTDKVVVAPNADVFLGKKSRLEIMRSKLKNRR